MLNYFKEDGNTFDGKIWLVPHLGDLCSRQQSHPSLFYKLSAQNNVKQCQRGDSSKVLPGEVCVVLVDQIFLDPEIIVAGWKEHDLLLRGVVTIPEGKKIHQKTDLRNIIA